MRLLRPLRFHHGKLQTAQVTLSDGTRQIVLVSMMHVGEKAYYDGISKMLSHYQRSGVSIHYEKVIRSSVPTPSLEGTLSACREGYAQGMLALLSLLGGVSQKDNLDLPEGSLNNDISDLELFELLGERRFKRVFRNPFPDDCPPEEARSWARRLFRHPDLLLLAPLMPWSRRTSAVVIGRRNQIAVHAALQDPAQKVALLWGAAHTRGMVRLLKAAGFKVTGVSYRNALAL